MGNQVGFSALVRHVKEEAPYWATTLPQLPRLIHHALSTPDRIEAARRDMARLAQAQRRQSLGLTVVGTLLAALLALELWRLVGS
jgi:ubiquinone biosynthesis protein